MWEFFQDISLDISILAVIISASILYFGKLISDTHVEKYDRMGLYITGLLFSSYYVFLPFLLSFVVSEKVIIPSWIMFIFEIIIVSVLSVNLFVNEYFYRFGWTPNFKKAIEEGVSDLRKGKTTKGKIVSKYEDIYKDRTGHGYADTYMIAFETCKKIFGNKYVLFLSSFIMILTFVYSLNSQDIVWIGIIGLTTFLGLTMLAVSYGFRKAQYPYAVIILENDEKITGRIQKFGDYVYILDDEKEERIFINKDKIRYIVESKYKNKKVEK
jgi:sRNA-binding regulator protein Hfq